MKSSIFKFYCPSCNKDEAYRDKNCFVNYRMKRFAKGEYIAYRGDTVNQLFVISKGRVAVDTILDSGMALISIEQKAPFPLGAVALFSEDNRYRVDMRCESDCEILIIHRDEVENQMVKCRQFLRSFISYNTSRLDVFGRHLSLLSHRTIKAKLAYYILLNSNGMRYRFPRSIADMANYFCVERPSLSRAISQMVKDGVVSYHNGEGEILDIERVKNML